MTHMGDRPPVSPTNGNSCNHCTMEQLVVRGMMLNRDFVESGRACASAADVVVKRGEMGVDT